MWCHSSTSGASISHGQRLHGSHEMVNSWLTGRKCKELHFMLHYKLSVLIAVCKMYIALITLSTDKWLILIFALHRSQSCFSWGNLPDDLVHYILQIHASNIIKTAFRNSLLRRVHMVRTRGHMHFQTRYRYKLDDSVWDLPLVWNSLPLVD